jgi:hypothetical protein
MGLVFTPDPQQCPHTLDDFDYLTISLSPWAEASQKRVNPILCNMQYATYAP